MWHIDRLNLAAMTTGSRGSGKRRTRGKSERTPAIYRGGQPQDSAEMPTVQHGARTGFLNWRIFSGLIVVGLCVVIFLFFSADAFYIHTVGVSGLRYLKKEEIFRWADIADTHLFWIDPSRVRESIMRAPAVADVEVILGWPPNMVLLNVQEREPALVWRQGGVDVWVDIHGYILMQPPEERSDLVSITVEGVGAEEIVDPNVQIPAEIVSGALQLGELVQNIPLRYDPNPTRGLGFVGEGGWDAWFGAGTDMPTKILVYEQMVVSWQATGRVPQTINVANPDSPYDCCSP